MCVKLKTQKKEKPSWSRFTISKTGARGRKQPRAPCKEDQIEPTHRNGNETHTLE